MAPPRRPSLIVVHSSDEMYGADRMLLQVLAALRSGLAAEIDLEVWLPTDIPHGEFPLCEHLSSLGYQWRHVPLPILRRDHLNPLGLCKLVTDSIWVYRALRHQRPDLIHIASSACLLAAPAARMAGVRHRVLHIQERWSGPTARLLRLLARTTTISIAISDYVAAAARLQSPAPVVVPNCVDDAASRVVRPVETAARRSETGLTYIVASRWNRWKGHDTLLRAWELAGCPGRLVVLGGVPPAGQGVDVPALVETLVNRPETVDIVGEVSDAAPYIAAADVVVLPSDEPEPFGLVIIEAFSLGRPAIVSRAGGAIEIVSDGKTGWSFEMGDPASLADLFRTLCLDEVRMAGDLARQSYERSYQPARYRRRIAGIFGPLLVPTGLPRSSELEVRRTGDSDMESGLALVSVFFESEVHLQHLQACSIDRFVPPGYFEQIIIIDNTARGLPVADTDRLIEAFGSHIPYVRIRRPHEIAKLPLASGWRVQQVLKLKVARQIGSSHYVVLDAKNHFVGRPHDNLFVTSGGRARVHAYPFDQHPLRESLERVLRYAEIPPEQASIRLFSTTVTPFVMETARTCRMIDEVERRAGRPFAAEFVAEELTEFFLYTAWALRDGSRLDEVFDLGARAMPVIWPKGATEAGVQSVIATARGAAPEIFSVHRRALMLLDQVSAEAIARYWVERGLFGDADTAVRFIDSCRQEISRFERTRGIRELPARSLVAWRRLVRTGFRPR